ncbi:threonylcarbamoyl-AMP synthase [Patescibacteria group bacterium]|nr:threonylcarbamoyl-AMP synthase [Patescibacteria group bacterium]
MEIIQAKNGNLLPFQIEKVVRVLQEGGIVVYPTDTLYGVGCNAFDGEAVKKIFELKGRSSSEKVSVLVGEIGSIKKYAYVGMLEEAFLKKYLPGPVTVILKLKKDLIGKGKFAGEVVNDNDAVGFRVIDKYNFINEVCLKCGFPIVATSANLSQPETVNSNVEYVLGQFADKLDLIDVVIDAGDLGNIIPSTVVDISKSPYQILRKGAEDIEL